MNRDIMEGKWTEFKGKVQKQWGKLTDDDLDMIKGSTKELTGKIQARYGYEMEKAQKEVDDFLKFYQ
jgi:uncharacterized protein YjbJ (UPF0337 family)